jgi:hypothetical protein
MRCPRREWKLAAVIAAAGWVACSDNTLPEPTLTSIEPASAFEASSLEVTIRGDRLFRTAYWRLGSGTHVDSNFRARLGDVPLSNVRWVSSKELTARVPDTLLPGTHSLTVEAPNGTAELTDAFVVIPIEHCASGGDDDGDGLIDCADPDCAGLACEDGDPCTDSDTCTGGLCSASPKSCTPPSACFSGGCDAGTCGFSVLVGASCVDPNPCTTGGTCAADGGCVGTSTCAAPGECWSAQCASDGGCLLTVNTGQSCVDPNPCMTGGTCAADGACAGTSTCAAPGECWSAQCAPDGGCLLTVNTGQSCSVGTCSVDGGCVGPPVGWPYPPSNFDPGALTPPATPSTLTGCDASFDTTIEIFVTSCGPEPRPNIARAILSDGREATVLAFKGLTISSGASLTLTGQRPAILAVFGNATIDGQLLANSTNSTSAQLGAGATAYPAPAGGPCAGRSGQDSLSIRAGGGGAGYRDPGGTGGTMAPYVPGAGGTIDPTPGPEPLRGGCPGGNLPGGGRAPGTGGGALQLSASGELIVSGVLSVSGGGGGSGLVKLEAGQGGGSGGTLVLEGDRVTLMATAKLTSNGGGGGGGSGQGSSRGSAGADGTTATSSTATGGNPGTGGGAGGAGGAGSNAPQAGAEFTDTTGGAGGGGGGSAGAIFVRASPALCSVSPTAVISPPRTSTTCPPPP